MFVTDQFRSCSLPYYLSGRDFAKCPVCQLDKNIRATVRTSAVKVSPEHKFKTTLSPFIVTVALEKRMLFAIAAVRHYGVSPTSDTRVVQQRERFICEAQSLKLIQEFDGSFWISHKPRCDSFLQSNATIY